MAGPYYVVVASGQTVTAAFALDKASKNHVVEVPSLAGGNEVRPQFSSTSGGPFWTMQRYDGSGLPFAVHSGVGPAIGMFAPPTPWGRFTFTGSPGDVRTLTVYPAVAYH